MSLSITENPPVAPKRKIGRPPHKYSKYFVILDEKANRIERFAMCKACILNGSTQTKIINRKRNCRSHLRKCQFQTEEIQLTDKEASDEESSRKSASKKLKQLPGTDAFFKYIYAVPLAPVPVIENEQKRTSSIPFELNPIKRVKLASEINPLVHHPSPPDPWLLDFESNLLRFTLANDLPFRWIENPESIKFLQFLDPSLKTKRRLIPSGHALFNRILERTSFSIEEKQKVLAHDKRGITLIFDGWKNVRNDNLMGLILVDSRGNVLIWDCREISAETARTDDVIFKVEDMLGDEKLNSVNIIGVVMDSSNVFCSARQQLRRKYWRITWIPCFAHQVFLCVSDIFCIFKSLHTVMGKAIRMVQHFNTSIYHQEKLKGKQNDMYGKFFPLIPPCRKSFNSFLACVVTLISSKAAIQAVVLDSEVMGFSDTIFQLNQSILPLPLEEEVAAAAMDSDFWTHLEILGELLKPFVSSYHQLQSSFCRLHHVIHSFGLFIQLFTGQSSSSVLASQLDVTERAGFLSRLEKRWKEWEHPLLILAYFLHPKYRGVNFSIESRISTSTMGEWALKYYQIWFHQQPKQLLAEMQRYQSQIDYPFTIQVSQQFYNSDVLDYWNFVSPAVPELGRFATRLLSLTVTSGSCDRLFGDLNSLQNSYRISLDHKKALSINQVKSDVKTFHKENAKNSASLKKSMDGFAQKDEMLMNEMGLVDMNEAKVYGGGFQKEDDVAGDYGNDGDDVHAISSVEEWQEVINEWIKLLEEENLSMDGILDSVQNKSDFIHPADDPLGKWPLEKLFGVALEPLL